MTGALLALLLSGAPELNTEGFELYKKGRYAEALDKFRAAIAADGNHALAHYNFAATLGLLRKRGQICEFDAYQSTILEHLAQSVSLDERRRTRMRRDADFDSVRDTLGYQQLLKRDPANDTDVNALLIALGFITPARGAYGHPEQLDLKADGTLTLKQTIVDEDVKQVTTTGTWKAKGRTVTLTFKKKVSGVTSAVGTFNAQGHLVFTAPEWDFSTNRSECDA
ncbi:MAG: copper resistance protein NlpE N-terminal domain-containing protein [Archangium sp.]